MNLYNVFLSPEQIRWIDLRKNFACLKDKETKDNLNNNNFNQCKHLCGAISMPFINNTRKFVFIGNARCGSTSMSRN